MPQKTQFAYRYERTLQGKIIAWLQEEYGRSVWVYKAHDAVRVGVPDLILCFFGHFVCIELKARDNVPTPLQAYNIDRVAHACGTAFVARDIYTVQIRLRGLKEAIDKHGEFQRRYGNLRQSIRQGKEKFPDGTPIPEI